MGPTPCPLPLRFKQAQWEGEKKSNRDSPGGGCWRSLTRGYCRFAPPGRSNSRAARGENERGTVSRSYATMGAGFIRPTKYLNQKINDVRRQNRRCVRHHQNLHGVNLHHRRFHDEQCDGALNDGLNDGGTNQSYPCFRRTKPKNRRIRRALPDDEIYGGVRRGPE